MTGYLIQGCSLSKVALLSPSRIWPNFPLQLRQAYQPKAAANPTGMTIAKKIAQPEVRCLRSNSSWCPGQAYSSDVLSSSWPPSQVVSGMRRYPVGPNQDVSLGFCLHQSSPERASWPGTSLHCPWLSSSKLYALRLVSFCSQMSIGYQSAYHS